MDKLPQTSRNKPKAAIVSMADYEQLLQFSTEAGLSRRESWLAESERLTSEILTRRQGEPLAVDALWLAARNDLEVRDEAGQLTSVSTTRPTFPG